MYRECSVDVMLGWAIEIDLFFFIRLSGCLRATADDCNKADGLTD